MLADVLVPVFAALLSAAAGLEITRRLGGGALRAATAAVAGGVLVGLLVAEVTVDGAGRWWAEHPVIAATFTGVLLLALTVLLVEAVIERVLKAAEDRCWHSAAQVAACGVLEGMAEPIRNFQDEIVWVMGEGVQKLMNPSPREDPTERAREFAAEMRAVVLGAAPVLTATERLHGIYAHALRVAQLATEVALEVSAWRRESREDASLPMWASEGARLAWWGGIGVPWQRLVQAAADFEDAASGQIGAFMEYEPWEPPWRERPVEAYLDALHDYLDEYGHQDVQAPPRFRDLRSVSAGDD